MRLRDRLQPGPMRLLDRMLLREMTLPLGVGVLAILQLLVLVQLLQLNEVVFSASMRLADLGRVTLAFAPHFLVLALPLAYMLGIQLGVGRLAADRELEVPEVRVEGTERSARPASPGRSGSVPVVSGSGPER